MPAVNTKLPYFRSFEKGFPIRRKHEITPEELQKIKKLSNCLRNISTATYLKISGTLQRYWTSSRSMRAGGSRGSAFISPSLLKAPNTCQHSSRPSRAERLFAALIPFRREFTLLLMCTPDLLKEYQRRWYMIGLNIFKEQLRTYFTQQIRDIDASDIAYKQKNFNAEDYFKNSIGIISPQGETPSSSLCKKVGPVHDHPTLACESEYRQRRM